jgi:hypothetical protein
VAEQVAIVQWLETIAAQHTNPASWPRRNSSADRSGKNKTMNKNLFRWLSLLTGLLYLSLFYQLLFTPEQILQSFGVGAEPHVVYLARRISVLMLGFSVLVFLACNLRSSKARAVIATAMAVNMAGFAVTDFRKTENAS